MCLASTASPCSWFLLCCLEPHPVHHSLRGGRQYERNLQITPTECLCVLSNCVSVDLGAFHFPVSPGILHRYAPVSFSTLSCLSPPLPHGTFCRSPPFPLCRCVPHFSPACFADLLPYTPWYSLQMCPHVPVHTADLPHLPQSCFVSIDPHLTLKSPLEPWPSLLSVSSPKKGLWASQWEPGTSPIDGLIKAEMTPGLRVCILLFLTG